MTEIAFLSICLLFSPRALSENCNMDLIEAINRIRHASVVEGKLVGEKGERSAVFCAYDFLRRHKDNKKIFENLYETVTDSGKVYLLIWFYENDRDAYVRTKVSLDMNQSVRIKVADVARPIKMEGVINEIES